MTNYESILIKPILSEKTNNQREEGKYVFKVDARATKLDVMEAVRKLFNVHPVSCSILNVAGKPKRQRYRMGLTASWKKATVTLPKEEKIPLFEGV
jgi:large subunit ribosomal protein L23